MADPKVPAKKLVKDSRDGVIFNDPLPPPDLNQTVDQRVNGNIKVNDPQCRIMGVTRDHFVTPAFSHDQTSGDFTVTIPANNLWDSTLYILIVYSQSQAVSGSIFLDTRP